MNADDLFYTAILLSMIFAIINVWNFRKYKALKIENELLKYKLNDCEQRRTTCH